jgi:hypothetical protein
MLCGLRGLCVPILLALVLSSASCAGTSTLFRQYEYEEEVYLALDGSATIYVNSSLAALNALRGTAFDVSPSARVDTNAVRAYFSSPATRVIRVSQSRRSNRRFVHIRLEVDDITKLASVAPFAWSTYKFTHASDQVNFLQNVGKSAGKDVGNVGWTGNEIVAFRLHLPSKIRYHNTRRDVGRGNILVWEQSLSDRLHGVPLELDARMDPQSILYTTLALFGVTFLIVAAAFAALIWWIIRRGKTTEAG